jgi:predicted aspartyl protease
MRSIVSHLACLCGVLGGAARADDVVPFREAWGWAIVVPVEVGGAGVHEFLVDTGSSFTLLEPALAEALGLKPSARADLVTLNGRRPVVLGRTDLTLGQTPLPGVEVAVAEMPAIRSDEPRVRGLLGQSALARLEYTIDHARRRLVVHGGPEAASRPREDDGPEAIGAAAARPIIEGRPGCRDNALRFVLDSGISAPVLFRTGADGPSLDWGGPVKARTNAGEATWREARLDSLCVAGRRSEGLPVVVPGESGALREEDGLLPSRFFARVRVGRAATVLRVDHW